MNKLILIKGLIKFALILGTLFQLNSFGQTKIDDMQLDYTKANTNDPKLVALQQVPKGNGVFVWLKSAAAEPGFIYEGRLRGHGFLEPYLNSMILALKKEKIPIYVDYFTGAKTLFYMKNPGYSFCALTVSTFGRYKNRPSKSKNKNLNKSGKFNLVSFPLALSYPIHVFGIAKRKRELFKAHLWENTQIYNVKSMLDDPNLYTTQVTDQYSMIIIFAYDKDRSVIKQYKKRIYDFVASNAIQITMMLNANRMDYADLTVVGGDFYIKRLKIPEDKIKIAYASGVHPSKINIDDYLTPFFQCGGYDLEELKKVIKTINSVVKKLRTNMHFWEKVFTQFSKDFQVPYESPLDHSFTKEVFKLKKELDNGDFDINYFQ